MGVPDPLSLNHHAALSSTEARVTLIVACYNQQDYIERALDSAFNQDYPGVRVIVTDDASADNSQERVRSILKEHNWPATLIFHKDNAGICATFNEALRLVETSYVAFISADDWAETDRLSIQCAALDECPDAALVYGPAILTDESGNPRRDQMQDGYPDGWPGSRKDDIFTSLLFGNWIPAASVLSRTSALREVGGFDESLTYEDWDMWLRLARRYTFVFCERPLVYYRLHAASTWSQMFHNIGPQNHWETQLAILQKHLGHSPKTDGILRDLLFQTALEAWKHGTTPSAVEPYILGYRRTTRSVQAALFWILIKSRVPGSSLVEIHRHAMHLANKVATMASILRFRLLRRLSRPPM